MFHKKLQVHIAEKLGNPQFKMTTAWIPQFMFMGFLMITMLVWFTQPVYAADIFSMAKNAMQKVYNDVVGIATVVAVVCSAVCLFLMNFSKSGKTVDESRTWLTHCHLLGSVNGTWSDCKLYGSSRSTAKFYWLKKITYRSPPGKRRLMKLVGLVIRIID